MWTTVISVKTLGAVSRWTPVTSVE
jgi:hypothetical protein